MILEKPKLNGVFAYLKIVRRLKMHAEIIAVGTEILLGQIVNTNATFLSEQLAQLGIDVYYQSVVGDNAKRLAQAIKIAAKRNDLVILTGGLGPTPDDLTKQTVAAFLGKKLCQDDVAHAKMYDFFAKSKQEMAPNNLLQTMYFEDAQPLANETGLAVGIYYQAMTGADFLLLPGPPNELKPMFLHQAKPLLQKNYCSGQQLYSRVLRFFGIGESILVTKLADLIDKQTNPTIAPYAKTNEVTLRLTASADNQENAKRLLDEIEEKIKQRVGKYLYGYGDENSLPLVVVNKLKQAKLTISASESLTGGLFQKMVTDVAGASEIFAGGFVTYAKEAKANLLDIDIATLDKNGVVSFETACLMAKHTQEKLACDIAVSFTGVAGPATLENQPAGTVWIGLAQKDGSVTARKFIFPKQRELVREKAALSAFAWINEILEQKYKH